MPMRNRVWNTGYDLWLIIHPSDLVGKQLLAYRLYPWVKSACVVPAWLRLLVKSAQLELRSRISFTQSFPALRQYILYYLKRKSKVPSYASQISQTARTLSALIAGQTQVDPPA